MRITNIKSNERKAKDVMGAMNKQSKPEVTVATRRQTPEEERHLSVAIDLFLAELVRQQLVRDKEASEQTRAER